MAEPGFRWTQDEWDDDQRDPTSNPAPLRVLLTQHRWLIRGVILLLALVVFELTANAAISTAVSCLELGRTDFQTAWWLRRTDPDRSRGRICSLCYYARAFWRAAMAALAVSMLILLLAALIDPWAPGLPGHFLGALILMACALAVASVLSFGVVVASLWTRRQLWLGDEPRLARQQGVWPPSLTDQNRPHANEARVLFYLGCFFVAFPTLLAATFACFLSPLKDTPWAYLAIVSSITLSIAAVIAHLKRRVLARAPADCWPLEDTALAMAAS